MKKIDEGVTADIFEVDADTIVKLYKPIFEGIAEKENFSKTEYEIMSQLVNYPVPIPRPIEPWVQGHRRGFTMQKVRGSSMMFLLERNVFFLEPYARFFGRLHSNINKIILEDNHDFPDTTERTYASILRHAYVLGGYAKDILALFDDLPGHKRLCHNDFHLANVVMRNNRFWVIDWDTAGMGDYHGDIARTVMLMRFCPPGIIHGPKTWKNREKFIEKYLDAYNENIKIDHELLLKWEIIKAADLIILDSPLNQDLWAFIEKNIKRV